ncbi:UvrD-helicase domain-containing protein [Frankia sp. AvcI1]|uniref:UvrD-helicase domain-containing protein n=1 Tax=Frankia sp. AvcI1 TaxID=573496 RepID=UPI002118F0B3|nr:UvrD-helicase domain-containing protein [Frankia sp. AvcI1]
MTVSVILSDLFQASYDALDGSIKTRVMDFLMKLQRAPDTPGLDLKQPKGAIDRRVRTARVNDNFRAVLLELPKSAGFVLAAVKPHDDAYTFASHVRFGINEVTGALELTDTLALSEATATAVAHPVPAGKPPILGSLRERDLVRLGIDSTVAGDLLRIADEDRLLDVASKLPRAQADAVLDLAAGRSVDEVWADLVGDEAGEPAPATDDVLVALERPLSRLSFSNPASEADLRAVLEGSFEKWRVWLHPLQRRIAYRHGYGGPFRVTGGAGTGKTVTALHRAVHLAGAYPNDKILFTTFTRTLAQSIKENLVKLAGPAILQTVDVLTIDGLARRVLAATDTDREKIRKVTVLGDTDQKIRDLWEQAAASAAGNAASTAWSVDFLITEWSTVVLAQGITDRATYLKATRAGRGRRLSRIDRAALWQIFERFALLLDAHERTTFIQIASRAAQVPTSGVVYRHAVVDEAQDLHPAHWRLLRHVVPSGPDDIFLVGDAHQRIYAYKVTLSTLGIETRGRSRRLTVNYRTSREILRWCMGVIAGTTVDDLEDAADTLAGARSEFTGPPPRTRGYVRREDELSALASAVQEWIGSGILPNEIGVVARTRQLVEEAEKALRGAGLDVLVLASDSPDDALRPGVRLVTMHRVKGLEFRAVALVGFEEGILPFPVSDIDDAEELERRLAQERCLAYVAGSRAREHLQVTWTGRQSPLLPPSPEER